MSLKSLFLETFTWWNNQTLSTKLFTLFRGKFVGKDIVYAGLWKKKDRHMIYNLVYLNNHDKKSYIKRFSIESIIRDKVYPIAKNIDDSKILYITGNPNSESEITFATFNICYYFF